MKKDYCATYLDMTTEGSKLEFTASSNKDAVITARNHARQNGLRLVSLWKGTFTKPVTFLK